MKAGSAAGLLTMTGCATLADRSDADADWLKAFERPRTFRNAEAAMPHLDPWFVTAESRMAPHLNHA